MKELSRRRRIGVQSPNYLAESRAARFSFTERGVPNEVPREIAVMLIALEPGMLPVGVEPRRKHRSAARSSYDVAEVRWIPEIGCLVVLEMHVLACHVRAVPVHIELEQSRRCFVGGEVPLAEDLRNLVERHVGADADNGLVGALLHVFVDVFRRLNGAGDFDVDVR